MYSRHAKRESSRLKNLTGCGKDLLAWSLESHVFWMQGLFKEKPPFGAKTCTNICPRTLPIPRCEQFLRDRSSSKTLSFEEQITSKDTYTSICSHQMEAIEFIILPQYFCNAWVNVYEQCSVCYPWVKCLRQWSVCYPWVKCLRTM